MLGEYPDTPEGALNKNIKAVIAEYERTKITERLVRGRRREAKRGSIIAHGRPPYGYDLVHDGDKYQLVINEEQAQVIRLIFDLYTGPERMAGRRICTHLNEAKIPAPRGGEWRHGQLRRMLNNETYNGRWYYGKYNKSQAVPNDRDYWITVSVPSIVDPATWKIAQERSKTNKELAARNTKREYLLRGRIKCGACGRRMGVVRTAKNRHAYFRCDVAALSKLEVDRCDHRANYRQDIVDAITWDWVMKLICDPEGVKAGWERYQTKIEDETAPARRQLAIVENGIGKHTEQLNKLLDLYLSDTIGKEMLLERQARLKGMIDSLHSQRDKLQARLQGRAVSEAEIQSIQTFAAELAERLDVGGYEGDIERMRQVLDVLDVRATLAFEDGERVLYLTCRLDSDRFVVKQTTCRRSKPENHNPRPGRR